MRTTEIGSLMEEALKRRHGRAQQEYWLAFDNQRTAGITRPQFEKFLEEVGAALTTRLWNIAIDEAERIVRSHP